MWDFSVGRALSMMVSTLPFIVLRVLVYAGIAVAFVLVTGAGAGFGWGIGHLGDSDFRAASMFWGGFLGFGVVGSMVYFAREYLLYVVKAGHIAVMVRLMDGVPVPGGRDQISYATEVVKERFAESSVLFAIDQLVKGVMGAIIGLFQGMAAVLPIPGLQNAMGVLRALLRLAVGLVDEIILAYAIRTGATNPWRSAETALVLYTQNYKVMLKNAAWLTVFTWGLSVVVFLVMLAPAAAVVALFPNAWGAGGLIFALIFAWAVKVALIEPFAIACMLQVYFRTIADQVPDPAWESRIASVSAKFRQMKDKAAGWLDRSGGRSGTPPAGASY